MTSHRLPPVTGDGLESELLADVEWTLRTSSALGLAADQAAELAQRAERVRSRLLDPALYLAVVGEFNAGKSTFVNTLLRDQLLPTAPVVTTGSATRIVQDTRLTVAFHARSGRRVQFPDERCGGGGAFLRELRRIDRNAAMPVDARDAVRTLIADPAICSGVETVTIGHPAALLGRNVVIVDTPGINATDDLHANVIERVVAETADLAVVLVPSNAPASRVLLDFLSTTLHRHLDRCVFVVTRLDDIEPEHRGLVLNSVRTKLRSIGVLDPQVYGGGGGPRVLRQLLSGGPAASAATEFLRLEAALSELARTEHTLAISTSATHLVSDLLEAASASVIEHRDRIARAERELDGLAVRDLDGFVNETIAMAQRKLRNERRARQQAVDKQVRSRADALTRELSTKIDACTTTDQVAELAKSTAAVIVRADIEKWCDSAQRNSATRLAGIADTCIADAGTRFEAAYARLAVLAGHGRSAARAAPKVPARHTAVAVNVDFGRAATEAASSVSAENWVIGGAGTAGAVLGTILLPVPVLGTVIGGLLGTLAGAAAGSGGRLAKAKTQVREPLLSGARKAVELAAAELRSAIDARCGAEEARCRAALHGLRKVAAKPVAALLAEERARRAELAVARTLATRAQREADERLGRLAARRVELAGMRGRAS